MSRCLYGQSLEHIGGIVNNGVWAEMLDDLKFYYAVTAHPPAGPADRQTVVVDRLGSANEKHPLRFEAAADTDDARLEIVGTGTTRSRWLRLPQVPAL